MSDAVMLERRGPVLVAHLDDGKANALSASMITSIDSAITEAENDDEIRALVIHGRPGRFSAGFDLSVMGGDDFAAIIRLVADGGALVHRLYGSSVPVVAACTGHALAAGALILLGCDVRVGADVDAKIGLNEVAIRMVLPDWAFTIGVDRLSRRHLQRAIANARITTPAEAVDVGFLDEVAPAEQVLDRTVEVATEMATTLDPAAYAKTVEKLRGDVLTTMGDQVASDRASADTVG
ncbi:MAG: crotonase/enoyl-CoA hydratase family protein [Actinomycetota bacterium]